MTVIIRDKALCKDDWRHIDDDTAIPEGTPVIIDWTRWQALLDGGEDDARLPQAGVAIPNTLDLDQDWPKIAHRPLIALAFPAFPDGRAYSQARLLRNRFGFAGEVRATGEAVVRDQLFNMARCGINAFVLRADQDPEACLAAFTSFGDAYQPACDDVQPIWTRRRTTTAQQ